MPPAPQHSASDSDLAEQVRSLGQREGLAAVGFTSAAVLEPALTVLRSRKAAGLAAEMQFTYRNPERSTDPTRALGDGQSIIACALAYGSDLPPAPGEARVARYAAGNHYARLREILGAIADLLKEAGHSARVHMDDNNLVDRNVAWRAGIGWFGKNANLLVPGVGSWVVLGNVITSAQLDDGKPPLADGCGPCRRCLDGCPTGAILAPGIVDAGRCIAWLVQGPEPIPVEFREAVGDRIYGCDQCQDVCPESTISPNPEIVEPLGIMWVLQANDTELMERVGHWYIANRDPNVVRRTALVVLGNTGDPSDPAVKKIIETYMESEVDQLREHATWAHGQLGLVT